MGFAQGSGAKGPDKGEGKSLPAKEPAALQASKVSLEVSETLFSLMAALNSCGYDEGLDSADSIRQKIRDDLKQTFQSLPEAARAHTQFCSFYRDHRDADPGRDLSRFLSLAVNMSAPPVFATTTRESDLPPDAQPVLGVIPFLQRFYDAAKLHALWTKYEPVYERDYVGLLHDPVSQMIQQIDVYLRNPLNTFTAQRFAVFIEPQIASGQVNARNYASNYYIVVSPTMAVPSTPPATGSKTIADSSSGEDLKMDQIRHTYLHYMLDPLIARRANTLKKLAPISQELAAAPLDDSYKNDMGLLVIESLIQALEARIMVSDKDKLDKDKKEKKDKREQEKDLETARTAYVQRAMEHGFVLTRYFYEALVTFEKQPEGFQRVFSDMLYSIDVDHERKRASETKFAKEGAAEVIHRPNQRRMEPLDMAEDHLSKGEPEEARKIAQQALDDRSGDPGRAMFILARVATMNKDMDGARTYFEGTLQIARDPRVVAWSHIYLARIFDIQQNRERALMHYNAALNAGDVAPDTKNAAERGIERPYQVPAKKPQ